MEGEEEMKKRYLRRILAMILSVLMIIGTVPTSVFAEGITKDAENKDETELVQNSEESVEKKVQDDKTEPIEGNTSGESDSKKQEEDNSALEESTPTEPEETVEQPTKDKTNDLENKTENEENEKTAEENKTENQPEEEIKKETEATSDTTESVEEKSSEELLEELPESVLLSMNETKYDSYDQFLAYYYLTYSPLDYYVNSEELPYQTYIKNSDKEFKKELAAWRLATLDAGKTVEYSTKEVEFYEVLIYDILYQEMAENTILKNSDTGIKALQSSLIKEFADLDYDIALDTKVTADNAGDLLNKMLKLEEVQFLSGNVETIQKGIEYTKNVEEVLRKLAMIIQLQKSSEEIGTILKNLSQSATDERMKKACEKVANIASGTMSDAEILGIFTGEIAAKELATYTLGKVWDTLANSSYLGRFIKAGQEVGKLTSNILFSTDEIVETWYSMEQIVKFDGVLKKELLYYQKCFENNPSEANAKLFNQAADMYLNTVSVGVEYATKYVEAVKGKGVLGWIYKNLTHKDDYNKVIEQLNSIKNSVDQAIEFANNKTYDFYLEDMQTVVKIPWEKTGCEITKEEIDKTTSEMPEIVFELTDQNVKQNTTYSEDKLTYGDFTLNGGTLNLDEKALTVYGDFYLESGKLDIHKGSLNIKGNLYMRGGTIDLNRGSITVEGNVYWYNQDEKERYTSSSASLIMEDQVEVFDIRGDLITYLNWSSGYNCSAGTMKLGGNWTNYNHERSISGSNTFKLELDGTKDVTIDGSPSIYVPNMEVKNSDSRKVNLQGTIAIGCVIGDAKVVAKDTPSLRFGSATGKIEVTGNMQTYGNVKVGKSFVVHGDLYMREGTLNLNGGNLKVEGNAYLCKQDSKGNYTSMASNSGDLIMENKEDILDVRGNLITYFYHSSYFQCSAGTLKLGGNWTNYENISGSGNFKVEADETAGINGVESIYVPNLEVKSTDSKAVTLKGTVETGCVIGDAKVVAKDTPYLRFGSATGKIEVTGNMWTYGEVKVGKSFVVHGDLHMKGGNLNLNGGNLTVEGNAYFCSQDSKGNYTSMSDSAHLVMENKEDTLDVRGDLVTYFGYSGYFQCSAGTLKLGGNWTNYKYISGSGSFKVEADETAGINGVESIYVPNLKVKSTDSKAVTLKGKVNIDALSDGDIRLATEGTPTINIGTVTGDLEIDGNAKLTVSKVTGNITVGGNLYSTGFVMGAHTLNVGGNFYLNTSNTVIFGKSGSLNVQGDVWMSDGTLSLGGKTDISGTVYQSGGLINVNGGILKIAKDYRIQDTDNSTGELEWVKSYGRLKMTNKKDCVLVGGNFYNQSYYSSELSAGTLVILGDFYQIGESGNFYPSGTHAVLLAGKKNQKVSFEATGCKFNILQLRRTSSYYLFEPDGCWSRLEQKVEVPEWVGYKEPEKLASGYCGSNLTWILTDDGVLKFSGEGNMRNYSSAKATSWYAYRDKIVSIELEPEITSIGEFAFSDLPKLKEIASWDGITSVGDYAFKNSTALENVVLPSKMKKLGGSAFYGCTELKSVSIPEGVYTVWGYTFKNCTSLKEVKLPSTLVKIDEAAFYGCKSITKMKIPESVSIIGIYCFKNCSNLSSVTLSDNMTQIREAAFYGTALKEIKIPDNVTVIGSYAFKNCIALEKVQFSKKLTKIDDSAFYACQSLTSLVIPENVTTINSYAFRKCTGLQSVTFPQSLKTIGESAFYGCSDLKELKIPEGVEALGGYSFKGCVVAQTITLPSTLKNIGESAFYGCSQISEIIIPENVETLGAYTFSQCTELKTVKFAGNAPVIGAYAFARVTAKVSYPSGNTTWNKEKQQNYGGTLTWSEAK